ncbi:hypothetical protein Vi05172_g8055 [Venturia inaequalis]|nr:hypothetical protein Vi05172_g8055 [Venturia inaequalis]
MSLNSDRIVYRSLYTLACLYSKYLYYSLNVVEVLSLIISFVYSWL